MTYIDIDASFEKNVYNDVGTKQDIESVKASLYNNILISYNEMPFDNSPRSGMEDLLHDFNDSLVFSVIKDTIYSAANNDPRIDKIKDISIDQNPDTYQIIIKLTVSLNFSINGEKVVNLDLIFKY